MTDDPYKKLKKRLHKMAQRWQPLMGLQQYDIAYEWWDRPWDEARPGVVMHVTASWCYKWATIKVNLVLAHGLSRRELEGDLLHEIGHVLCAVLPQAEGHQTSGGVSLEEERLVSDLSQIFQRVALKFYKAGLAASSKVKLKVVAAEPPAEDVQECQDAG